MLKKLSKIKNKFSGRNNKGKITVHHRGGGARLQYRVLDFVRAIFEVPAVVLNLEYDPNRTSFISLILYKNGILSYILATSSLKRGSILMTSYENIPAISGNTSSLQNIALGSSIHNIELNFGKGGQLCRAAGCFGVLLSKNFLKKNCFVIVRLQSKEEYIFFGKNLATVGISSNLNYYLKKLKKAGNSRHLGVRPHVRGVAMNPIDHPHGGGEGKTSGGRPSVSPWGKLTKGKPTRSGKNFSNKFIAVSRKKL